MAAKIKDGVFIADAESSQDPEFLDLNKITYLINCAGKQVPNFYASHGCIYLKFDWDDSADYAIFDSNGVVLRQLVEFIDQALANGASVLVFSLRGVSRCVACVSAYLMYKYRWGFEKTYSFIMSKRPDIELNTGFCSQLQNLDRRLQAQRCKGDTIRMNEKDRRRLRDWDPGYLNDYPDNNSTPDDELLLVNSFLNSQQNFDMDMPPPRRMDDKKQTAIKWSHIVETDCNEAELLHTPSKPRGTVRPILRTSITWVSRHAAPFDDDSKQSRVQTLVPSKSDSTTSNATDGRVERSISETLSANTKADSKPGSSGLYDFVGLKPQSQTLKRSGSGSGSGLSLSQMLAELEAEPTWSPSEVKARPNSSSQAVNNLKSNLQTEGKEQWARRASATSASSTSPDPFIVDLGFGGSKGAYEDSKASQSTYNRRQPQPSLQDLASADLRPPYSRPQPLEAYNTEAANAQPDAKESVKRGAWVTERRGSRTGSISSTSRATDVDYIFRGSVDEDPEPRRRQTSDASDGPPVNVVSDERRTASSSRRRAPSPTPSDRQTSNTDSTKRAGGAPVYRHGSPAPSRSGSRKGLAHRSQPSQVPRSAWENSTFSTLSAGSDIPPASTTSARISQPSPQRGSSPSRTRTSTGISMGVQQPTAASAARVAASSNNSSQSGRSASPSVSRRPSFPSPADFRDPRESIRSTARQRYGMDMGSSNPDPNSLAFDSTRLSDWKDTTGIADTGTNGRPSSASRTRASSGTVSQQRWR